MNGSGPGHFKQALSHVVPEYPLTLAKKHIDGCSQQIRLIDPRRRIRSIVIRNLASSVRIRCHGPALELLRGEVSELAVVAVDAPKPTASPHTKPPCWCLGCMLAPLRSYALYTVRILELNQT